MTQLGLHRDLSYCRIDDHLIFLDIQNDRYFRLAAPLESALVTYLSGGNAPDHSIRRLIEQQILIDEPTGSDRSPPFFANIPTRSAVEETTRARRTSFSEILDTLTIVGSTQLQLKNRGLKQALCKLADLRGKQTSRPSAPRHNETDALDASTAFRSARLYVPIDTCCLLDSIAMVKFLAKRELYANLVFGVTADPFSAHCWVQYGTTVLNDALGHVLAHTPIRVI